MVEQHDGVDAAIGFPCWSRASAVSLWLLPTGAESWVGETVTVVAVGVSHVMEAVPQSSNPMPDAGHC